MEYLLSTLWEIDTSKLNNHSTFTEVITETMNKSTYVHASTLVAYI